jgi:hypothetical protein
MTQFALMTKLDRSVETFGREGNSTCGLDSLHSTTCSIASEGIPENIANTCIPCVVSEVVCQRNKLLLEHLRI